MSFLFSGFPHFISLSNDMYLSFGGFGHNCGMEGVMTNVIHIVSCKMQIRCWESAH